MSKDSSFQQDGHCGHGLLHHSRVQRNSARRVCRCWILLTNMRVDGRQIADPLASLCVCPGKKCAFFPLTSFILNSYIPAELFNSELLIQKYKFAVFIISNISCNAFDPDCCCHSEQVNSRCSYGLFRLINCRINLLSRVPIRQVI